MTLTLGPILADAALDLADAIVIRHAYTTEVRGIHADSTGGIAVVSRAGVASLRRAVCCLDARRQSIWWQKMDDGGNPRILTDLFFHE